MELTKEQRNEIYRLTLDRYLNYQNTFLCECLSRVLIKYLITRTTRTEIENFLFEDRAYIFPEFYKGREDLLQQARQWWHPKDRESRIKHLEECIKATNTYT